MPPNYTIHNFLQVLQHLLDSGQSTLKKSQKQQQQRQQKQRQPRQQPKKKTVTKRQMGAVSSVPKNVTGPSTINTTLEKPKITSKPSQIDLSGLDFPVFQVKSTSNTDMKDTVNANVPTEETSNDDSSLSQIEDIPVGKVKPQLLRFLRQLKRN